MKMKAKSNRIEIFQKTVVFIISLFMLLSSGCRLRVQNTREVHLFTDEWRFFLGDVPDAFQPSFSDSDWRLLNLPHDWSIEGHFSADYPAGAGGGALPGGIGWYRKTFTLPLSRQNKLTFIDFDGVYQNSEVWINGHFLGRRPNGYISFRYELTPYLNYGEEINVIAVKADNSQQPNSRWYSGSGIYRNVRLVSVEKIHVDHWGTSITAADIDSLSAKLHIETTVRNASEREQRIDLVTKIMDPSGREAGRIITEHSIAENSAASFTQSLTVENPQLWSIGSPVLYSAETVIKSEQQIKDQYITSFGIRYFHFDAEKGFFLNGRHVKIKGVCNHHDLGCLGAAVNIRAVERQLEILKAMGCNAIRTAHNPPSPELLDLCDRMGFIVMAEAFDVWKGKKTDFDYHLDFDEWHKRDLRDIILRDRNHPSVFIWSIGNEVIEQWDEDDSSAIDMTRTLAGIVKELDNTRPVTAGCNNTRPDNPLFKSEALDLIGFNYHHQEFADFPEKFPGQKFIAAETVSALASRAMYDMPSDSIRRWPVRWDLPFYDGNPDYSCSSYDNCSTPWGSTHEETWKIVKKHDFISGMFVWTGFDYLGEPTPYGWPARSSYFGIIDLAGFPKDIYYMYQSEWTDQPVLHVFPHWNWQDDQLIDVWIYTNCIEVELFLNDQSLGSKTKSSDDLRLMWRLNFKPGTLKAVGRMENGLILTREIRTASAPAKILLEADRKLLKADGRDLSFVTVKILDKNGTLVPGADNRVRFTISGPGKIAGVDNGSQTSHEPFQAEFRKAFNGKCLAVIQSDAEPGIIRLQAQSEGLEEAEVFLTVR